MEVTVEKMVERGVGCDGYKQVYDREIWLGLMVAKDTKKRYWNVMLDRDICSVGQLNSYTHTPVILEICTEYKTKLYIFTLELLKQY